MDSEDADTLRKQLASVANVDPTRRTATTAAELDRAVRENRASHSEGAWARAYPTMLWMHMETFDLAALAAWLDAWLRVMEPMRVLLSVVTETNEPETWSADKRYALNDLVQWRGKTYRAGVAAADADATAQSPSDKDGTWSEVSLTAIRRHALAALVRDLHARYEHNQHVVATMYLPARTQWVTRFVMMAKRIEDDAAKRLVIRAIDDIPATYMKVPPRTASCQAVQLLVRKIHEHHLYEYADRLWAWWLIPLGPMAWEPAPTLTWSKRAVQDVLDTMFCDKRMALGTTRATLFGGKLSIDRKTLVLIDKLLETRACMMALYDITKLIV